MNILIAYETYSGGTQVAAERIEGIARESGHTVTAKKARDVDPSTLASFDLLLFGSPSWMEGKQDGQPHQKMIEFLEKVKSTQLSGKKFAVFGTGDRDFARFTHAVDIITEALKATGAQPVADPLRLDSFWFKEDEDTKMVTDWATTLLSSLPR